VSPWGSMLPSGHQQPTLLQLLVKQEGCSWGSTCLATAPKTALLLVLQLSVKQEGCSWTSMWLAEAPQMDLLLLLPLLA